MCFSTSHQISQHAIGESLMPNVKRIEAWCCQRQFKEKVFTWNKKNLIFVDIVSEKLCVVSNLHNNETRSLNKFNFVFQKKFSLEKLLMLTFLHFQELTDSSQDESFKNFNYSATKFVLGF